MVLSYQCQGDKAENPFDVINQRGKSCLLHPSSITVDILAFSVLFSSPNTAFLASDFPIHPSWVFGRVSCLLTVPSAHLSHRIIGCFSLEGTFKGLLVKFPVLQLLRCLLPSSVSIIFSSSGGPHLSSMYTSDP